MKKLIFLMLVACFVTSLAFAQQAKTVAVVPAVSEETLTLSGDVIDNMCADAHKEGLADFAKTHSKECALSCVASGYSILVDGKLHKFDVASNVKIEEFLKNADSKLQVTVTAKKAGEELSLVSIENQK